MSAHADAPLAKQRKNEKNGSRAVLPTDRIAFPKQLDLLRAWAAASGPANKVVNDDDVSVIVKMVSSTIRMANPFFCDVGFLKRVDGSYIPSSEVVSFNRAFEWNPETAPQKLAPLLEQGWFAEALMRRLSFGQLSQSEAIQVLAEAANAGPEKESQLSLLLSYMSVAGMIVQDNGSVRRARHNGQTEDPAAKTDPPVAAQTKPAAMVATAFTAPTEGVVQFHVSVKVDMKEFAGWEPSRIAKFFSGIAQVLAAKGNVEQEASST